eukprot:204825_1
MGLSSSKQLAICSFCQSEIIVNGDKHKSGTNIPLDTFLCPRCDGFYTKNPIHRSIQHLHIAPFQDTLATAEEKEISDESIIDTYLKPYFAQHPNPITAHTRVRIRNVEFKVFGCYPPRGVVDDSTRFHLNDNNGRLLQLQWRPIQRIHLLPTNASLTAYLKQNPNTDDYPAHRDQPNKNNHNEALMQSHLMPYLKQNDAAFYIDNTAMEEEEKTQRRHLMEEETFAFNGIEWRVMKCLPPDGYIDNTSTIYCHGDPVMDCNKISIRPIFESLPNLHKNYTPRQIKSFYLDPFFRGRCRYIDHSREIKIFGVDFSIRESLPSAGIITLSTMIDYNAAPVKAVELQEMQAQEDMELARQLQEEENNRSPFPSMNIHNGSNPPQYHQVTLADITEIFERLQAAQSPSNTNNPNNDPFLQFIRQLQIASQNNPRRQRNAGVNPQLIDRLPTIKYRHNQEDIVDTGDDNMDINKSCRICLEYYEAGEELRFLPCFHKYHKECVDRWFQMSSKCPICKTSISQPLRQNVQ